MITYEFGEALKKKANETDDAQLKLHIGDFSISHIMDLLNGTSPAIAVVPVKRIYLI